VNKKGSKLQGELSGILTWAVKGCIECHKKPGEAPKGKDAPKLDKKAKMEYFVEALHENCRGCHKAYNKEFKTKAAPTTCAKCHQGAKDE